MNLSEIENAIGKQKDINPMPTAGDTERLVRSGADWVGNKLGYDPGLSRSTMFPGTEDIQRRWGARKRGGAVSMRGRARAAA